LLTDTINVRLILIKIQYGSLNMALLFEKDVLGRYQVRRDDGLFVVNPIADRTQVLPQLQAIYGSEVNPSDVANQLNALDAANISPEPVLAQSSPVTDDGTDLNLTTVVESDPDTVMAVDTVVSSDDSGSNN
jgi:hypothetical protein